MTAAGRVIESMARILDEPVENLPDDIVLTDLVADSFLLVEMAIRLQDELEVRFGGEELRDVRTVGDLRRLVEALTANGEGRR